MEENAQKNNNQPMEDLVKDLEVKLEAAKKNEEEYLNGWKRAKADLVNYKRDEAVRFGELFKYANEEIIKDIISVLLSFDLALASGEEGSKKGLELIKGQLGDILKRYGLVKLEAKKGQKFDPALEEIVGQEQSEEAPETIIEVVQYGYSLNGRVVKPAKVIVSKGQD